MNINVLQLRPGMMHLRHGIRWNAFNKEMEEKNRIGVSIKSIDVIEAVELFLNIYFGLLVREEKSANKSLTERDITYSIKPNISEMIKVRNRFIHIDYEQTNIKNVKGEKAVIQGGVAFIPNIILELNWVLDNQMNISRGDFEGIRIMVKLIFKLIEKCDDFAIAIIDNQMIKTVVK